MTFIEVLLNVLAIIGIVFVGGFLIYLIGGVVLSILEAKNKKEKQEEKFEEEPAVVQPQPVQEEIANDDKSYEDTLTDEKFMLEDEKVESVDYAKATEEKRSLNAEEPAPKVEETDFFADDKEFNFEDFDFDAFFNEQNEALQQTTAEEVKPATTQEEVQNFVEPVASQPVAEEVSAPVQESAPVAAEPVQQHTAVIEEVVLPVEESVQETTTVVEESVPAVVEPAPVVEEVVVAPAPVATYVAESAVKTETAVSEKVETNVVTETTKTVYVENKELENALREEIAALKAELAEQKALYEALKAESEDNEKKWEEEKTALETLYQDAEKREAELNAKSKEALSIEEYEARLEVLRERLKVNEFELRANRKEFLPLKKVRKNLDKDKSKLRRREALVAKQKVLLYGVNNISEIDQEKAKRLAEDLDLLDGLKVSVRHCEEVMEANKERYPILETANRILITANEEIKADILACENAIRKLKGEDVDGMTLEQIALAPKPAKRGRGRPRKAQPAENQEQTTFVAPKVAEEQDVNVDELMASINADRKILHTAQTEQKNENYQLENVAAFVPTAEIVEPKAVNTQTTISIKKQETTISQKQTHNFDFDADEPSMEDLFAIENEDLFDFDDEDRK